MPRHNISSGAARQAEAVEADVKALEVQAAALRDVRAYAFRKWQEELRATMMEPGKPHLLDTNRAMVLFEVIDMVADKATAAAREARKAAKSAEGGRA